MSTAKTSKKKKNLRKNINVIKGIKAQCWVGAQGAVSETVAWTGGLKGPRGKRGGHRAVTQMKERL